MAAGRDAKPHDQCGESAPAPWDARAEHQALVEHVPAIIYEDLADGDTIPTVYIGPQLETILGLSRDEWVSDPGLWERQLHPDDRARAVTEYLKAIEAGGSHAQEYRMLRPDGRTVWIRDAFTVLTGRGGDPQRVRGVMFDISEQKRIEAHLWEAETKYQALVEQIPAILYVDLPEQNYRNAYVSPQIEQILGITPERYANGADPWIKLLHPEDRERVLQQYEGFLSGGPDIEDYRMVRPDGRVVWIRDRATLIRDAEGTVIEQGVMFDVTEQKEAEAIVRKQVELLEKVDAIGKGFTDLLLRGTSIGHILEGLEKITGHPVVLEDAAHQVIELTGSGDALDPVLASWETHSREGHAEGERGGVRVEEGSPRCAWITIWLRDGAWGRLHMLEAGRPAEEVDLLALDRAAAAVGLALLSEREAANLAEHASSALITDTLHGRYASSAEVLRRAKG